MISQVYVVEIPAGMATVWGWELLRANGKWCALIDMNENVKLVQATWKEVGWETFRHLTWELTCNRFSWRGESGNTATVSHGVAKVALDWLENAIPGTIADIVNDFRDRVSNQRGTPAALWYSGDSLTLVTSRDRRLTWDETGKTLVVQFGEDGSHGFLEDLIWKLRRLPVEALRPVERSVPPLGLPDLGSTPSPAT